MPRAEAGSTKHLANQMKAKGLQRLRWYCQACQRQMRDENGFKCHVASESHVRNMMVIGEDPRKAIHEFSMQFQRDFVQLLRTGHGEKKVNVNHFYQEYIGNKEHVHMNATKWASLTEFAKHLGREGICRVEEDEKNSERGGASALMISWIDNSPEKLRRQEVLRKKERQDRGDEEREQKMIAQQIRRAKKDGLASVDDDENNGDDDGNKAKQESWSVGEGIKRVDGEKIKLNFGSKKHTDATDKPPSPPLTDKSGSPDTEVQVQIEVQTQAGNGDGIGQPQIVKPNTTQQTESLTAKPAFKSMSFGSTVPKPKNIFAAAAKKNAFAGVKKAAAPAQQRVMSEAERIMKEEIERKRQREQGGGNTFKRQKVS